MPGAAVLGRDTETVREVVLDFPQRYQGMYVLGAWGTGKSTFLLNLVCQDMRYGLGLCVLDPHGDLIEDILARVPERRIGDVALLDITHTECPFGLNIFDCEDPSDPYQVALRASQAVQVFKKIWGPGTPDEAWGMRMEQLLRNIAFLLLEHPGHTMADIRPLLLNDSFRKPLVDKLRNEQVKQFWQLQYNNWNDRLRAEWTDSTLNKVDTFLSNPAAENIVAHRHTKFDFRSLMDTSAIVLCKLPLRMGEDLVPLIGSLLLTRLTDAVYSRGDIPEDQRVPFHLYIDEYHKFATPAVASLFTDARKFRVAVTIAHQERARLDDDSKSTSLQMANKVVFRVGADDAEDLGRAFPVIQPPPEIVSYQNAPALSLTPVIDLIRKPPVDSHALDLVRRHLKPLVDRANSPADTTWYTQAPQHNSIFADSGVYLVGRSCFVSAIPILDEYLSKAMSGEIASGSKQAIRLLGQISLTLRAWLRLERQYRLQSVGNQYGFRSISNMREEREELVEISTPSEALVYALADDLAQLQTRSTHQLHLQALQDFLLTQARTQLRVEAAGKLLNALPPNPPKQLPAKPELSGYLPGAENAYTIWRKMNGLHDRYKEDAIQQALKEAQERKEAHDRDRRARTPTNPIWRWIRAGLVGDFGDDLNVDSYYIKPMIPPVTSFRAQAEMEVLREYQDWRRVVMAERKQQYELAMVKWNELIAERERYKAELNNYPNMVIEQAMPILEMRAKSEIGSFLYHLQGWLALTKYLQSEPILVDSYKRIPVLAQRRPIADIQNEMFSQMALLKNHRAWCLIMRDDEPYHYTITTYPAPAIPDPDNKDERVARIRAQSCHKYGYKRSEVEVKIRERQLEPKEDHPRTSRSVQH